MRTIILGLGLCVLAAGAETARAEESLLPDKLGPMEHLLWSESGLMRKVFDFPLTEQGREREMEIRRPMLALHQMAGFTTLASMVATVALGQTVFNGKEDLSQLHQAMAWTTVGAYLTTATFSIFTPPPLVRRAEWSTVSTHKLLATIHLTGMCLTPFLGTMLADGRAGDLSLSERQLRLFHLSSGYVTTATFATAILVVTF